MPYTRTSTITTTTMSAIDDFVPQETFATLNEALIDYGLSASETVAITDASYHTLANSPTAKGTCILSLDSTLYSAIFVLTKNATTNNCSKISSVGSGSVYLTARWTNNQIEVAALNNTDSFSLTANIKS